MKTTSEIYKESIAEFDLKFSTLVAEHEDGTKTRKGANPEMLDFIKSHTIAILDSSIERLRGELYENKTSECNCRGWDNGIQKEIDHLTAQRVILEKL